MYEVLPCPCKGCKKRWQKVSGDKIECCHTSCKDYLAYKESLVKVKNHIRKEKQKDSYSLNTSGLKKHEKWLKEHL